jgi:hypothetical protein
MAVHIYEWLGWSLLIGLIVTIYYIIVGGGDIAALYTRGSGTSHDLITFNPSWPIAYAPFLLLFIPTISNKQVIYIIIFSALFYFIIAIFSTSRELVSTSLFSLVFFYLLVRKNKKEKKYIKMFLTVILIALLSQAVIYKTDIIVSFDYIYERYTVADNFDQLTSSRQEEWLDLCKDFSIIDWLFGRGLGGSHLYAWRAVDIDTLSYGISGLHYGFAHLIFKGGLLLLGLIYGLCIYSLFILYKKRSMNHFYLILLFLIKDFHHNSYSIPLIIMLSISLSYTLYCRHLKSRYR